ncbi:MAG TPA: OmpA family protein [Nitrospira sp.]|nr:OmpA family protein [Nitrospira sp.]
MQGKDSFLVLLGVFILGMTFFFCGRGAVTAPPPVALEHPAEHPPQAQKSTEPQPSPPPPSVSVPAIAKKKIDDLLIGKTIPFRINSVTLLSDGKVILNGVAAMLREDPTVIVEVNSQTDIGGPERANQMLSEQRTTAVVEYLVSQGIAAERLVPKGYDASRSSAVSATDEGRRQNRRIELSIGTTGE